MDFLAVASLGTYPASSVTTLERAAFAATYGLFGGPLAEVLDTVVPESRTYSIPYENRIYSVPYQNRIYSI